MWRVVVVTLVTALALWVMAWLLEGFTVDSVPEALLAGLVVGLVNAVVWPALAFVVVPISVLTLGLGAIALDALLVAFVLDLLPGVEVSGFWTSVAVVIGLTVISTLVSSALALDDDAWFDRSMARRVGRRARRRARGEQVVPGIVFVQVDGLARSVLERALRSGDVPTLHRWLAERRYRLVGWETGWSSQTGVSQCGILHGSVVDMPAFRWVDKATGAVVVSNRPASAAAIEARHSDGEGLLAHDGSSYGNLFSGDAERAVLTMSGVTRTKEGRIGAGYRGYFARPQQATRTLVAVVVEVVRERAAARAQRRRGVEPRVERGWVYALLRAFTTVVSRDVCVNGVLNDICEGRSAIYVDLLGYDEVSHHSGPERADTIAVLRDLDHQIGRIERAIRWAPRPYHLVVLSDHGQTGGATFKQRYGLSLEELVRQLARDKYRVQGDVDVHEDWGHLNVMLTEAVQHSSGAVAKPLGQVLKRRSREGQVALGPEGTGKAQASQAASGPGVEEVQEPGSTIVVLASGNLGLVYGTQVPERATLELIEEYYPGILDGLAQHEGVGFIMVRSEADGPVVIGSQGRVTLEDGRVEGQNPLANFGPNAARHLLRYDGFADAPDLYVSSFYDPETNEGAAFEEQIGFHGGMGGWQTQPFLLCPTGLPLPDEPLVGAAAVHGVLKGWVSAGQ